MARGRGLAEPGYVASDCLGASSRCRAGQSRSRCGVGWDERAWATRYSQYRWNDMWQLAYEKAKGEGKDLEDERLGHLVFFRRASVRIRSRFISASSLRCF